MAAFRLLFALLLLASPGFGTGPGAVPGHPGWSDRDIEDKLSEIRAEAADARTAYRLSLIGEILQGLRFNKEVLPPARDHVSWYLAAMMEHAPTATLQKVAACRPRFQMIPDGGVPSQTEALSELPGWVRDSIDARFARTLPDDRHVAGMAIVAPLLPKLVLVRQDHLGHPDLLAHEWAHLMYGCAGGLMGMAVAHGYHADRQAADLPFSNSYAAMNGAEYVASAAEYWFSPLGHDQSIEWLRTNDPRLFLLMWRIFGPPRPLG